MVDAISATTIANVKANQAADTSAAKGAPAQSGSGKNFVQTQPLNPRLVYDNLSGVVITEFLNQSGTVQLQTPSSAVLAYLRVGLGADGHSKYQPEVEPEKTNPEPTFDS